MTTATKSKAKATSTTEPTSPVPSPQANNARGHIASDVHRPHAPGAKQKAKATANSQTVPAMPSPDSTTAEGQARGANHFDPAPGDETNSGGQPPPDTQHNGAAAQPNGRAISPVAPTSNLPGHENNGDGQPAGDAQGPFAAPEVISSLRELQAQRTTIERMCIRMTNSVGAYVRRAMGWRKDLDPKEGARIKTEAAAFIKAIEAKREMSEDLAYVATMVGDFVRDFHNARLPFEACRKAIEKKMEALAKSLPVWSWVEGVRGLGAMGLGIIVGEAGDLGKYSNPAKLWKRFGLAPIDCYRDITLKGEDCVKKPRRRRSAMWRLGDAMVKQGDGYRQMYLTRKAYELEQHPEPVGKKPHQKFTKMHLHRRAQRYMEKRVLRDLWRAWRDGDA